MPSDSIERENWLNNMLWRKSRCSQDRRFHIINGKPLYRNKFDEVMSFHEPGLAPARIDDCWFHIKADGSRAYSQSFDRAWGFYFGRAAVNIGNEAFHIFPDGNDVYIQRFLWVGNFQEELCAVRYKNGRYGHILLDGNRVYPLTYSYVGDFKENTAVVQDDDGLHFHIIRSGQPLNGQRFADLGPFHKGLAPAKDDDGWFHVDLNGKSIYERRFEAVEPFYNGQSRVLTSSGSRALINYKGNTIAELSHGH